MAKTTNSTDSGHTAIARALNLPVSTKQCVEICRSLRFKDISYAKKFVEEVSLLKRAVPYKRSVMNIAHKAGMSSGRYPQKAAKEILRLLKSVEANAQAKGLDVSNLKITKILANRASIPLTGGRHGGATKRTHVEVEVREKFAKKKAEAKKVESMAKETAAKEIKEAAPAAQQEIKSEIKPEIKPEIKTEIKHDHKPEIKSAKPVHNAEPSSEELLRQAQQKAAELKKREKEQKETNEVSDLYEQLKKKGSLRSAGGRK
ncbi:MAG: 50S ribosomal protein L22 [Nanoarchaeota archaeon]